MVKGPQGVEDVPGLLPLVPGGAQVHDGPGLVARGEQVLELVKADDPVFRGGVGGDVLRRLFRLPGHNSYGSLGSIVAIFHAGGLGLLSRPHEPGDGGVHLHLAQGVPQLLQRHPAGAEEARGRAGQVDDGGLHPHGAGAAVYDGVNLPVHVLQHVPRRGRAGPAGGVPRGGRNGHVRRRDDLPAQGVGGTAHPHRVQPRRDHIGDQGLAGQDHGHGAGPEPLCQGPGRRRDVLAAALQPARLRDVEDQGVVLGAALGLEDVGHRLRVKPVGPQAVHRLRGDAH